MEKDKVGSKARRQEHALATGTFKATVTRGTLPAWDVPSLRNVARELGSHAPSSTCLAPHQSATCPVHVQRDPKVGLPDHSKPNLWPSMWREEVMDAYTEGEASNDTNRVRQNEESILVAQVQVQALQQSFCHTNNGTLPRAQTIATKDLSA